MIPLPRVVSTGQIIRLSRHQLSQCYVRNVSQAREQDVDQEICAAATLKEDTNGREEDGEDDLDDVAVARVSRRGDGVASDTLGGIFLHIE